MFIFSVLALTDAWVFCVMIVSKGFWKCQNIQFEIGLLFVCASLSEKRFWTSIFDKLRDRINQVKEININSKLGKGSKLVDHFKATFFIFFNWKIPIFFTPSLSNLITWLFPSVPYVFQRWLSLCIVPMWLFSSLRIDKSFLQGSHYYRSFI